jgi:hypothetical protein
VLLPIVATVTFNDEAAQYAVAACCGRDRAGQAGAQGPAALKDKLALAFVGDVSGAAGRRVCHPKLFSSWAAAGQHVVAMASNRRLGRARRLMGKARMQSKATVRRRTPMGARYAARSWKRKRRVIIKAEVVRSRAHRRTTRALVTNLAGTPEDVYQFCG